MATIKQIRANRRNAKLSTGPKTQEGKDRVRFNALVHGLRAESAVIPGEDQAKFDQLLERLTAAWGPQDDQEKDLVEQIAVSQWKLARLDRNEARLYEPGALEAKDLALAIHRVYLTQVRLERSISASIADMERYRKIRLARQADHQANPKDTFVPGLLWGNNKGGRTYSVLPRVRGLDGVLREIPRELLGDVPESPEPNGHA
jgi:hypothetical protein